MSARIEDSGGSAHLICRGTSVQYRKGNLRSRLRDFPPPPSFRALRRSISGDNRLQVMQAVRSTYSNIHYALSDAIPTLALRGYVTTNSL
jgi:hypothetical protein